MSVLAARGGQSELRQSPTKEGTIISIGIFLVEIKNKNFDNSFELLSHCLFIMRKKTQDII